MHILIVDDDEDIVTMLQFRLEKSGYQVSVASTGKKALESIQSNNPDLVIMDLNIPEPNGAEVAKHVKSTSSIPIILLTGSTDKRSSDFQCDELVIKPYEWEQLHKLIEKYKN